MSGAPDPGLRLIRGEPEPQWAKASLLLRLGARLLDVAIASVLYFTTGPAGVVLALLYLLFADGMLQGQSPGKKLLGVKVIYLPTGTGARHRDSVLRNSPFGLVMVLGMMPGVGLKALIVGTVVVGAIEGVRCLKDREGRRLGDLWALTQVVDGKVSAGQTQLAASPKEARATARYKVSVPEMSGPLHPGAPRCALEHRGTVNPCESRSPTT